MLQEGAQLKRKVSVNLTEIQEQELKAMSDALGISMNVLLNLLIRYFIYTALNGILTLETLLKKYYKLQKDRNDKKTYKMTLRMKEREFQELCDLANQWLCLPGALVSILVELLIVGIIDINSIWNIQAILQKTPLEGYGNKNKENSTSHGNFRSNAEPKFRSEAVIS
jgi:hypothetical protein